MFEHKNVNFLLILKSKVFIFYYIMADTWCHESLIILDFIRLVGVTEKNV